MNTTAKSNYLLLLRQPNGGRPAPEDLKKIMAQFATWIDGLAAKGMLQSTNGLELSGKVLRGPRGQSVTDGPYVETKEVVGGFVIIAAASLDEALAAAADCPGLSYHMCVEVRPVAPSVRSRR